MQPSLRLPVLLIAVLVLGSAAPAAAQGLAPGTRVRVRHVDVQTVDVVARSAPDSLVLALPDGGHAAFPRAEGTRVERSVGRRGRPGRGALVGAGVMTVLSVADLAQRQSEGGIDGSLADAASVVLVPMTAAVGAGLVGLVWRTERWSAVPVRPTSTAVHRAHGATLALRF